MKKTIILTLGAVAAVLIAGYLTGAEDQPAATTQAAPMMQMQGQPMTQPMQQPAETAEVSESFLILTACPMCHTCPVCQANCGTQHAMKCCVGKAKTTAANCEGDECCDDPPQTRHVMTNKADAVKGMVEGGISQFCTASALQEHNDAWIFCDEESASKLKLRDDYAWRSATKLGL